MCYYGRAKGKREVDRYLNGVWCLFLRMQVLLHLTKNGDTVGFKILLFFFLANSFMNRF